MPAGRAIGCVREGIDVEWQSTTAAPAYHPIDLLALGVILVFALIGWRRGLSGELSRFATLLLALALALRAREPLGRLIGDATRLETPADVALAYTLAIIIALIGLSLLRRLLERIMQISFTPGLEKSGGMLAGMLRGLLGVIAVFLLMNLWPHDYLNRVFGDASLGGRMIQRVIPRIRDELDQPHREMAPDTDHDAGQATPDRNA